MQGGGTEGHGVPSNSRGFPRISAGRAVFDGRAGAARERRARAHRQARTHGSGGAGRFGAPKSGMERNRLLRRPLIWIILVVGAAILLSYVLNGSPSYTQAKSSDVLTILTQHPNDIKKVTIQDKEQTIELDLVSKMKLPSDPSVESDKIQAQFPALVMDEMF